MISYLHLNIDHKINSTAREFGIDYSNTGYEFK